MDTIPLEVSLKDRLMASRLGTWAAEHSLWFIGGGAALMLALMAGSLAVGSGESLKDIRRFEAALSAWEANPADEALYLEWENASRRVPGKRAASRSRIGEILLASGRAGSVLGACESSLTHLRSLSPEHAEFAEISLLIAQGEHQKALEQAVAFRESFKRRDSFLYGFTLLRIAFLQRALCNPAGETAAWQEWREFARSEQPELAARIAATFQGLGELPGFE